jgi:hypothetical protein
VTVVVRTIPGVVDEQHRVTEPIPVIQVVDHDANDYDVRLDVSGHIDLIALAAAIEDSVEAWAEWRVLRLNRSSGPRRLMAAAELRRIPSIRAALTIALTPAEAGLAAGSLAERLEEAALQPQRCLHDIERCNRFAVGDDELCEEHLADLAEHGPAWDRGSYDYGDDAS